ncbi:type II secretion system inner membrane protein GspF [Propionivibrio dicarboxylicus]|uniref:General secretion pathway protein F n=1 Tax=Propionivibrio dicarboxylicus TaxID=83767 RepID=A0A1G8ALB2_9RHOO|nr:type II secretion system inner membrane protein GspF [Propionivibrio dicarboxylicus]SDH21707.1 general secretion pathway protein F [Propionivibrio dicarboxylicus]
MPLFQYQALPSTGGRAVKGVIEAEGIRQARALLRERGLLATGIQPEATDERARQRLRIGQAVLTAFSRQLSALLDAGLTVDESLTVLAEQSENVREKRIIAALRNDIASGLSLSAAMLKTPRVFPGFYTSLIRAGEESGRLSCVMQRLAAYLEERAELVGRIALAFIYPAVVFCVSTLVIIGMLTWVVPQMVQVFQGARQTLPLMTRALLAISAFAGDWGGVLCLSLAIAAAIFGLSLRNDEARVRFHAWRLGLPVFGRFERAANTARFAGTLAILTGSGVPLLAALSAAEGVMNNRVQRAAAAGAAAQVREGMGLARALAATRQFPPILIHLTASGEATGRLDRMLERAAQELARDLSRRIEVFTSLLGPAVVLLMGGVVLFIVLAILLPVFEINQFIR